MIFFLINFEFASITGAGNTTEALESVFWFEPTKSSSKRHKSVIHTLADVCFEWQTLTFWPTCWNKPLPSSQLYRDVFRLIVCLFWELQATYAHILRSALSEGKHTFMECRGDFFCGDFLFSFGAKQASHCKIPTIIKWLMSPSLLVSWGFDARKD